VDEHSERLSLTWVRIWGHHDRVVNDESDRAYYVVSGSGWFQVGDGKPEAVGEGDVVFIPRGVAYELEGEMTYLVMNGPAFATGSDRVLPSVMPETDR
jgi:mannose-6-phosphate isomerase-like protein (cupin superfamily)